jgi:hypothetical protein
MVVFAQLKLVEVVEGGGPEPGFGSVAVEMVHGRAEAAAGTLVDGEDARYDGVAGILVEWVRSAVDVERGGAPEAAPPGGKDLGARAFLGGEEGDDFPEDGVGEVADSVAAASFRSGQRRRRRRHLVPRRRSRTAPF